MSIFDNDIMNSDLDAFKNSGAIRTASFTFSGVIGAGQAASRTTSPITVESPDFAQILFDNSAYHSGKFKNVALELDTMVHETTMGSDLGIVLSSRVVGNQIFIQGDMFNPYNVPVTLSSTTINFQYIPYEATL